MAGGMGVTVDFNANVARFTSALDKATNELEKFQQKAGFVGTAVKSAFAAMAESFTVGAFTNMVKGAIDAADHLNDLSKKTGIAVTTLGGLGFAASQAGGDLESVTAAAGKLNKSIAEAAGGNKQFGAAFDALGINIKDANGNLKTADVVMADVADKFAEFEDGPEKAAIALQLFGKAGADIIPLLNDGGSALRQNVEYYKRFAGVTDEVASAADQFNDTVGKVNLISGAFGRTLAAELLPTLQKLADAFLESKERGTAFNDAARGISVVFDGLVIAAAGVATAFQLVGKTIAAVTANAGALLSLDFSSALSIGKAYREDVGDALNSLKKLSDGVRSAKDNAKAQSDAESAGLGIFGGPEKQKRRAPILDKSGSGGNDDPTKKLLANELKTIEAAVAEEKDILGSRNKFLDLYNSEGLISFQEYYAGRRAAQEENVKATVELYDKEIAALQRFKAGAGKDTDRAEADGKINDLLEKKAKLIRTAGEEALIASFKEDQALKKQIRSYEEARNAAQDYLDTLKLQQDRSLDAFGKGDAERNRLAGRQQIEDKYNNQIRELENDKRLMEMGGSFNAAAREQYEQRLAIIKEFQGKALTGWDDYYKALKDKEGDWTNGASEAYQNYLSEAGNIAKQSKSLFEDAFQGMEDALVNFALTGKLSFGDLAKSIIADIARIQAKSLISNIFGGGKGSSGGGGGLFGFLGSLFSGGGGGDIGVGLPTFNAKGNAFANGRIAAFANGGAFTNGIATSPTLAPMALFGEAGPEAIMPLTRTANGKLGVRAAAGGAPSINYAPVISIDSRTDRNEVFALVDKAVKQGNAQLVDRLQRSGRL